MMTRLASLLAILCLSAPVDAYDWVTVLREFAGYDGALPKAGLARSGSTLFGTTSRGGDSDLGTVFSIRTDGSDFQVLHEFAGDANGFAPVAGLTLSGSTLFGTTAYGGDGVAGTVFSIRTDGSRFQVLHEFHGGGTDGDHPVAGLTLSGTTLFGTTARGGRGFRGTVFSIRTDGSSFQLLHEFTGDDGMWPEADLTLSGSTLFGTTVFGGHSDQGTVFSINTDGSNFQLLHEFAGGANDGREPQAGLTLNGSTLFGTTAYGGDGVVGTVFSINTDGSNFQLLHEFAGGANDGAHPRAGLALSDSTLFGTTSTGGNRGDGTVFSISTDGSNFQLLHEFAGNDGMWPYAGLILSGSTLFGTTFGGDSGLGTVFSVSLCPLDLVLSFEGNTLTMDFRLGPDEPVLWSTWMVSEAWPFWVNLWSEVLPPLDASFSFPIHGFPNLGFVGILTTFHDEDGLVCWDFEVVDTRP